VMVLDASGSMDDPMGGGDRTKRIDALKSAANSFINTIAKQNEAIEGVDRQHRVAIVKFAGDKTDKVGNDTYYQGQYKYNHSQVMKGLTDCSGGNVKALKDTVAGIASGATRADYGLERPGISLLVAQMPRRSLCSLPTASQRATASLILASPMLP
ncbi:MAG: hypothetical protein ACLTXI_11730, partial [Collinsella sp.]